MAGVDVTQRHRVKISATVDPELLAGVDAYIRDHPDRDRSKVIDEALWLWFAREQERAMEEQFDGPDAPEEEMHAWRAIRDEAALRIFGRDRQREG
jgi:hypothetical protein